MFWILFLLVTTSMATMIHSDNINSTATFTQMTDKLISKLKAHMMAMQQPKSRGYDNYGYGYLDGYYGDVAGKSDYSWIVPLIIVIGFGTLLIPLLGTLMTTMMTQGTINLTAGRRRKRSTTNFLDELYEMSNKIEIGPILKTFEEAIKRFGNHN
ncbi:hypothetical protein DERF_003210 [Dermatophagoides farinae]|uniref:Methyltransferase-like protein n=1 Tax=Dermatophagoides farinae TaxID=6954 RepID=A0A922IGH4_DERFA|nr:methyltransferase-like protein [Dermatophagoides farinae]KAH9529319.1 hypothetical protein DERF_003210 [Dermatophagoides farinae]